MNRIDLIASLAKNSNCVLDVGCDHAYVLIKALLDYNCKRGIASDINMGPLNTALQNIKQKDLEISTMTQRVKEMEDELAKAKAEMFAVRVENGMGPEPKDLSSKERFDELEDMKRSIDELFEKSWKLTKKDIRHRLFSEKPPKKVKKKG